MWTLHVDDNRRLRPRLQGACTKSDSGVERRDYEPHLNFLTFNELSWTQEQSRPLRERRQRDARPKGTLPSRPRKDTRLVLSVTAQWDESLAPQRSTTILPGCASSIIDTHPPHKVWHYWRPENVKPHARLCAVMTPAGVCPQRIETACEHLHTEGGGRSQPQRSAQPIDQAIEARQAYRKTAK